MRVTTFVADHEALSADVAATQLKIGLSPACATCGAAGSRWSTPSPRAPRQAGATLRTRAAVRASSASRGWAVTLDEETLRADVVVVAAGGPDAVAKLLGERAPPRPGRRPS